MALIAPTDSSATVSWSTDRASTHSFPHGSSKGFRVECPDRANASDQFNIDFHAQVRRLLHMLGGQYRMQLCWSVDSNYQDELVEYARETERECHDSYPRQIRTATFLKFHDAMERRELRREHLHLYVSKKITANAPAFASSHHKDEYYRKLLGEYQREFELFQTGLTNLFAPSNVRFTPLDDKGHFTTGLYYLNPAYAARKAHDPLPEFYANDSLAGKLAARRVGDRRRSSSVLRISLPRPLLEYPDHPPPAGRN